MLSGTRTRNTPEENSQASSHPAMTSSSVIENVRYTNRYREKHAVNTSACSLRRLPSPAGISPRYPKSTCSSPPGGPSSTGVVTLLPPAPHRSAANRCSVRSATTTPCRPSKIPIFTTGTSPATHAVISSRRASSSAHPAPCPSGRTGRTTDTTSPISSSVSCSSPPARDRPAATAALTYRLLVLRSTPACAATARSLLPASQARSTSRISITDTSRNTIPATSSRSTGGDQTGMTPDKRRTTPLVQLLATGWSHAHGGKPLNLVPCCWRMTTPSPRSAAAQLPTSPASPERHGLKQIRPSPPYRETESGDTPLTASLTWAGHAAS